MSGLEPAIMLKACPFCAMPAHLGGTRYSKPLADTWWVDGSEIVETHFVSCGSCGASTRSTPAGGQQTPHLAADAWNRRDAFQQRVQPWMSACFGEMIAGDREERNHRFLEEALELVQACGCSASEAHQLVDYVFGRPVGEPGQETGGVMVTLAALCLANGLDMHGAGETELARIWTKVDAIRAKQAAKPKHSPLPQHPEQRSRADAASVLIAQIARMSLSVEQEEPVDDAFETLDSLIRAARQVEPDGANAALRAALAGLIENVRPSNWNDEDDPEQAAAWREAALLVAEFPATASGPTPSSLGMHEALAAAAEKAGYQSIPAAAAFNNALAEASERAGCRTLPAALRAGEVCIVNSEIAVDALRALRPVIEAAAIKRLADVAQAIGWQAGVGGRETAGAIVSYLATSPAEIEPFFAGQLNPIDFAGDWVRDGCLTWHVAGGKVWSPEEAAAARAAKAAASGKGGRA